MTKVLMISTDAKILEEGSPVRARMIEYGALFEELHIIVFTMVGEKIKLSNNTHVYPTNSLTKLLYVSDATKIGTKIIAEGKLSRIDSVITAQDPFETGMVGEKLASKFSIPLHIQIHTDFHSPYFKQSVLNKVRMVLAKKSLAKATAVRVVSGRIKASLSPEIQAKTSVLPIFTDLTAIRTTQAVPSTDLHQKYSQFEKIILMASRLTREKDFGTALTAFTLVRKEFPRAGLVIVGDGPEGSGLMSLGERGVVFEKWADHDTVLAYMKTCDVFLSASLYEGYGLSMLEAHTAGATLVATDAGIAPLLADEKALIPIKSPKNMAVALRMALGGTIRNKEYKYPYLDKKAYLEAYRADIERALV
jgi:glycosyltransferase involved in cell wall biosynthesis